MTMNLERRIKSELIRPLFDELLDLSGFKTSPYKLYEIMAEETKISVTTIARYVSGELITIHPKIVSYMEKLKGRLKKGEKLISKEKKVYSNPLTIKKAYEMVGRNYDIKEVYLTDLIADYCKIDKKEVLRKIRENKTKSVKADTIINFLNMLISRRAMFEYSTSRNHSKGDLIYYREKGFGIVKKKVGKNSIIVEFIYKKDKERIELLENYIEDPFSNERRSSDMLMIPNSIGKQIGI